MGQDAVEMSAVGRPMKGGFSPVTLFLAPLSLSSPLTPSKQRTNSSPSSQSMAANRSTASPVMETCYWPVTRGRPTPAPAALAGTAAFSASPSAARRPTAGCPSFARDSVAHTAWVSSQKNIHTWIHYTHTLVHLFLHSRPG